MAGILSIQFSPIIGNKEKNIEKIANLIENNKDKKLDLIVLPEFFSTGVDQNSFINKPEDENGGKTIDAIANLAKEYNVNIITGTVIEKSQDKLYNTSFAINRNGEIVEKYRKIHLFNYMGGTEGQRITPGNEIKTVQFDFAKVGLAICFDIRYPMHFKKLAQDRAQIIVLPTAWIVPNDIFDSPEAFQFAKETWSAINRTRAHDNMVYFVVSNQCKRVNKDLGAIGNSMIIAPTSQVLAKADCEECAIYSDIDIEVVEYYRKIFPIAQID